MDNNNFNITGGVERISLAKTFISRVFSWMFIALAITAVCAYFGQMLIPYYISATGGLNLIGWVVMLSPLALVLIMSARFQKLSFSAMVLLFIAYSILMGLSLSFIFLAYTGTSVVTTFAIASGMFGLMALVGYTTKTDLTRFGSIMIMGLIGIIIASLVNLFIGSSALSYIVSFIGVLVFTGLTAYDVQKLKKIGGGITYPDENMHKLVIMGALTLYLDFINLFLFLLRFFGNRK